MIDDKLNIPDSLEQAQNTEPNKQRTYSNAVGDTKSGPVKDLRTIILVNKNEELAEEKDNKSRPKNVIVNGKCDNGTIDDKFYVENLIKELQIGALTITSQKKRIGQEIEREDGYTQNDQ